MTLETAKRIKEGIVQRQEGMTYEQFMLLNKEAEAVLRGGMNICENRPEGCRKYKWIKVKPTKTDNESSIEQALAKYQKKPVQPKAIKKQEVQSLHVKKKRLQKRQQERSLRRGNPSTWPNWQRS